MAPLKILSFLALIVVVSSLSDASSRILKADENPNSEKDLPAPAKVLPQNNKEQNQNLQPGKKDDEGKKESGGNLKSEESGKKGDEPLNNRNDGKKSDEQEGSSANLENSNMGDGQNGSNDPSKNVKGDGEKGSSDSEKDKMGDRQNGSSDPSKNEESGKKGDGKKGSDDPTKNAFIGKTGDGKNGNNDPTKEEENGGKKGVGKKESSPATKKEETGKKGGEQIEGNDPSKNGENDNKGNDPLKNEVGGEKGDGKKGSSDPSKSGGSSEKGDGKKGSTDPSKSGGSSEKGDGKKGSNDPSKSGGSSEKDDRHKGKEEPRKEEVIPQSCDAKCDEQDFVACLQHNETGSQEFFLHVQNKRGKSLTVNITVPTSVKVDGKTLNIPEHGIQKVKVEATKSLKVTLDSEKGHCQLQIGIDQSIGIGPSINGWNPFNQLSSTQLMPIYGGFLLVILAIVGGVWGFCMFRRRRRAVSGIPYQQLEMGSQVQSSTAIESSSADGWDQSWDDDWDEEEATRVSNSSLNNRSLSSNGLSSRSPNKKNDWDIDWDD